MEGTKKIRAFLALKIPPAWIEQLSALQADLKRELPFKSLRWVAPEQIHLTLRFFGYILPADVELISARLAEVSARFPAFSLSGQSLGTFRSATRPRVLWVGLEDAQKQLSKLHAAIAQVSRQFGEPPDDRPFAPHLTLARLKEPERSEILKLQSVLQREFKLRGGWSIERIEFLQSHLSPHGARYELLSFHLLSGVEA